MDKELLGIIGENVKKYREKANLTQAELAEKVGIGTASVSRIERGEKRMKMETLRAFADALDISVGLRGRRHEGTAGEEDLRELARRLLPDFRGSAGE